MTRHANENERTFLLTRDALRLWYRLKEMNHRAHDRARQRYIRRYRMWRSTWLIPGNDVIYNYMTGEVVDA
jgi:hypothetical protein